MNYESYKNYIDPNPTKGRNLTVKQKGFLKNINKERRLNSVKDLTREEWNILQHLHDTEILWQNANRFIEELNQ